MYQYKNGALIGAVFCHSNLKRLLILDEDLFAPSGDTLITQLIL
ncbi:hypothetical protein JCM19235_952 [Vibrio maritimus]|uniref:Uncharacterized protein n=1 Tax=Vibrio maritimus TaxID=990268 RepID=A0A090RWF7_9VIBR|nr:hypothetical protein JCM19235_952 [Vibrio maritimus]